MKGAMKRQTSLTKPLRTAAKAAANSQLPLPNSQLPFLKQPNVARRMKSLQNQIPTQPKLLLQCPRKPLSRRSPVTTEDGSNSLTRLTILPIGGDQGQKSMQGGFPVQRQRRGRQGGILPITAPPPGTGAPIESEKHRTGVGNPGIGRESPETERGVDETEMASFPCRRRL